MGHAPVFREIFERGPDDGPDEQGRADEIVYEPGPIDISAIRVLNRRQSTGHK
jgi:hypothetical protein